jgi:hypothetical protein
MTKSEKKTNEDDSSRQSLLPHQEIMSRELLFRSQSITQHIIEERNQESDSSKVRIGATEMSSLGGGQLIHKKLKPSEVFNQYQSYVNKKKQMWLDKCWIPRSEKWYTLTTLIENGIIHPSERQYYKFPPGRDITDFPWRETSSIYRIKGLDGKEYYSDIQQWHGLDVNGTVHTQTFVADLYSYILPDFDRQYRYLDGRMASPAERNNPDVGQVSILNRDPSGEIAGRTVYTLEWSPKVLHSGLQMKRGEVGDSNRGVALVLKDESIPNMSLGIKTVQEFLLPFDELWKEKSEARPMTRTDTNKFVEDLTKVTEKYKEQQSGKKSPAQYR